MSAEKMQFAEPKGEQLNCVAFAHDGKQIVTGSGTTVHLWDIVTGAKIREYKGHAAKVRNVTFSPDDKFILSGGDDGTARIWDVANGQQVQQPGTP